MPQVITDVYVTVSDDPERSSRDPELARHGYEGSPETMPDDVPVSALLSPIVAEAAKAGLYVHLCMPGVIERMSRDAQGIVAVGDAEAMRAAMCDAFDDAACGISAGDAPTLVAAFWQVRDPGNAGTVIRAADAAGCMGGRVRRRLCGGTQSQGDTVDGRLAVPPACGHDDHRRILRLV
ncbi:RNA methyltransferase, TrmH family [Bifidobacterium pullorum]|uniref:RNA methyltransferase, TrmH family n=1 Tax=Bifidobacterium pullorum TaxID=78448 RepID=A0A7V8HRC0_9BIFI|nr:RNA methyltransferase, TrmH family [Bifidobacterium pullorum]